MLRFCLALTAAAFAAAPAFAAEPAEPPITNPTAIIDSVSGENMSELMRELGATNIEVKEANGQKGLTFFDGNVPYNLAFAFCDFRPGKCIALIMLVIVDPGSSTPTMEALNEFNKNSLFVTLVKLDGNRFGAGHLMVVDGGVTKKNLAINIGSFVMTFRQAMQYLSGQPSQVIAGTYLNRTLMGANRNVPPHAVRATPQELAQVAKALATRYQKTLRPQR